MRPSRLRILMLDGGRQALPFMKALKKSGHHITVACGAKLCEGYFSRFSDRRLVWADYFHAPERFAEQMLDFVRRSRPDVTISVGDASVGIVSQNKAELEKYTRVTAPDLEILERAADKAKTMAFCMANDIPCPKTFFPAEESLESIIAKAPFPVIVKPRRGIGALGIRRADSPEQLQCQYEKLREQYGELIVQERIPLEEGTQFQAEAFVDADSTMKVCMVIAKPRFFPVSGGTSTANVTIHRPDIQASVRKLLEGIHWVGAADVDLILDPRDNVPKILEINPRVTAGIKIGFAAGIDYADLHVRLAMGEPIPAVPTYKRGVYSRNLCMDLLWYLYADKKMRRITSPSFFRFLGEDVCYQTFGLDDPLPLVGFVLGMLKKYTSPKAWRRKLGRGA